MLLVFQSSIGQKRLFIKKFFLLDYFWDTVNIVTMQKLRTSNPGNRSYSTLLNQIMEKEINHWLMKRNKENMKNENVYFKLTLNRGFQFKPR